MADKQKNNKHDRHKRGLKLFFLPKPHGQKHKHKKNKYYVSHHDDPSPTRSIMSGDSPLHNNRTAEAFDFGSSPPDHAEPGRPMLLESKAITSSADGRSSPVASGSRDVAVQNIQPGQEKGDKEGVQASVIVEPGGKDKNDDEKDGFGSPTLNEDEDERVRDKEGEEKRRGRNEDGEFGGGRDKKDRKDDKFKKNGNVDKLDGLFNAKGKKQKKKKDDEDDCMVKCLYVTMTCCECSIM